MKELDPLNLRKTAAARWMCIATPNGVISDSLMEQLSRALLQPGRGAATILSGSGDRFFSPGLDLNQVSTLDRDKMTTFMRSFQELCLRIFTYPEPIVAAINGHALGGGCILSACCDFRIAVPSARIGLTDLNLDLALPYPSQRILEHLLGYNAIRRMLYQGLSYPASEALEIGLVDAVVEPSQLENESEQIAQELCQSSPFAFQMSKQNLRYRLADELAPRLESDLNDFLNSWFSPQVQKRLTRG